MLKQFQALGVKKNIYCILEGAHEKRRHPLKSQTHHKKPCNISMANNASSSISPLKCSERGKQETETLKPLFDPHSIDPILLQKMEYEALVWSSLHGLLVGDRASEVGRVPGVSLVHAPISLLPMPFPESHYKQACEVAPIFNELVDRVSLDADFLQESLSRSLLHQFKQHLALDPQRVPENNAVDLFAEAMYKAWAEYNNPRAIVLFVVQTEERNMYDQHWLSTLKFTHEVRSIRRTLAEIAAQGELLPDGTLIVDGEAVSVVYFRAGYAPTDYPSESEWSARLLIEQSCAIKCPSIAYHLAGTKKIQQELAKPNQLERFLENKDDIAKVRKCFAGLWSLDESSITKDAIERPGLYVMKPQREGGGNNIYGDDVRLSLQKMEKAGTEEDAAAYILMQRIFPIISPAILMREGISHKEHVISELGIYGTYLRNKTGVIMNGHSGYLMRTKVSSSNEGGVAAGFAVLDSVYLV
ncbi:glutathione synthetase chloroplastic [Phtheirospermum japonicum]|uniref:Glutathione synthetase n=1 Tax=Phtheirospermum japonicum TaxID=374723 RepID=A0A830C061_9LAMI|nr:glutathione synthetase chloroplastic [Phtheirospermum japonicum]